MGNDTFRARAIYGEAINRAARLRAPQHDAIHCDEATYRGAREAIAFDPVGLRGLRGLGPTVSIWTPQRYGRSEVLPPMHGRERELTELMATLKAAAVAVAQPVLIEGDTGIGKSRLLAELQQQAAQNGFAVTAGHADRVERRVPYRAWRGILAKLLGLDPMAPEEKQRADVLSALGPELARRAALLNAILPLALPEFEETQAFTPPQRARSRLALLLDLLRRAAVERPLLVTIDDAHWLDEESWTLAAAASREVPGLCLVLAMQPLEDDSRIKAFSAVSARQLRLGELSDEEHDRLALTRLGGERLARDLSEQLRARTRGHPFFCIELAQALRDEGLVEVVDGTCRIAAHNNATKLPLPDTVQATVTRRIDRLDVDSQVTLKVASAAGIRFPTALVTEVHPAARTDLPIIARHLEQHSRAGLLEPDKVDDYEGYAFRHGIIRDVAYGLMLYAQRRQLHREIASWYEKAFADRPFRGYALLAHHWEAAGEPARAADFLRLEAERVFGLGLARQSITIGLEGARLLGANLPTDTAGLHQAIGRELERTSVLLGDRRPKQLAELPTLTDARASQLIHLLLVLAPFAHQSQQLELFALLGCTCLRLTLEHGNGPLAPDVYGMYSVVFGALTGDRETAAAWSRLGLELLPGERKAGFSRCAFIHAWFHNHWVAPIGEGITLAAEGAEAGLGGNEEVIFGCFNLSAFVVLLAASGRPLTDVMSAARAQIERNGRRVLNAHYHLVLELQYAKALAGLTTGSLAFGDAEYDEAQDVAFILETNLSNQIGYYLVTRVKLHAHACDWKGALDWAARAHPMLPFFAGQPAEFELSQYRGLAALSAGIFDAPQNRQALIQEGHDCLEQLRGWRARNPAVFSHKVDLLDGLLEAAGGHPADAERLLQRAAGYAASGHFMQDAGLAHEYLARCKKIGGNVDGTRTAALAAREIYSAWGAGAKVALLNAEFSLFRR